MAVCVWLGEGRATVRHVARRNALFRSNELLAGDARWSWEADDGNHGVASRERAASPVLLPFALLGVLYHRSARMTPSARATVYVVAALMALGMPLIYLVQAPRPAGAPAAFLYVAVPLSPVS